MQRYRKKSTCANYLATLTFLYFFKKFVKICEKLKCHFNFATFFAWIVIFICKQNIWQYVKI